VLLPEVLHRRGYRHRPGGQMAPGRYAPAYLPNDRGFDSFYGALWSNDDTPYAIYRNRQVAIPRPGR